MPSSSDLGATKTVSTKTKSNSIMVILENYGGVDTTLTQMLLTGYHVQKSIHL